MTPLTQAQVSEPAVEHPRPGEVIWRDDAGVTCRQWNWRQCTRTRITPIASWLITADQPHASRRIPAC